MKQNKNTKGITLIALIITVIILLILAGVAVSISINNGDLFGKASQAREEWNAAVTEENTTLNSYLAYINQYGNGESNNGNSTEENSIPSIFKYEIIGSESGNIENIDGAYELGKVADLDGNIKLADNDSDIEVRITGLNYEYIFKDVQGFVYGTTTSSDIRNEKNTYKSVIAPYVSNLVIPSKVYIDSQGNFNATTGTECIVTEIKSINGDDLEGLIEKSDDGEVILNTELNVTLPDTIKVIDEDAFYNCTNLKSITLGNGLEYIGVGAFYNCTELTSIILPSNLESIGRAAFCYTGISSINIPASVHSIDKYAFSSCENLANIVVDANNTVYDSRNNCNAIIETSTNKLIAGGANTVFVEGIKTIGVGAFSNNTVPTNIILPSTVTKIENGAFHDCKGLQSIVMNEGLLTIGDQAFDDSPANSTYVVPATVTSIGGDAFSASGSFRSPITVYYRGTQEQWDAYETRIVNRTVNVIPNYTD